MYLLTYFVCNTFLFPCKYFEIPNNTDATASTEFYFLFFFNTYRAEIQSVTK